MLTITSHSLTRQTETEISALCRAFIEAMARTEPYSPEWRFAQWSLDTALRERTRRLSRPGWAGPR